jgi:hypothetical protein
MAIKVKSNKITIDDLPKEFFEIKTIGSAIGNTPLFIQQHE